MRLHPRGVLASRLWACIRLLPRVRAHVGCETRLDSRAVVALGACVGLVAGVDALVCGEVRAVSRNKLALRVATRDEGWVVGQGKGRL